MQDPDDIEEENVAFDVLSEEVVTGLIEILVIMWIGMHNVLAKVCFSVA